MSAVPPCIECDRELRPQFAKPADFPGTIALAARGRCKPCYSRLMGHAVAERDLRPRAGRPSLEQLKAEADRFAAARRARGVPESGVLRGGYQRVDA